MNKDTERAVLEGVNKRKVLLIFAGLLVAMFLAALDQTVFGVALPTIVGDLNGVEHMLWVTTAYILASTIVMPIYGKLGDQIGRKHLFISAILLFVGGSILGGLANDMTRLIIGRAVQGVGGGGLMILAMAIIADFVPARDRGRYMGIMGGVFALSSVIGPLLGGWFTESIGWRWVFWMNIPMGVLALVLALIFLPKQKAVTNRPKLDVAGIFLLAMTSTAIVLISTWGGSVYAWTSSIILLLITVAIVGAIAFIFVERRATEPVMPSAFFRDRNFILVTIAGLVTGLAMFGALAYIPTYMQMVTGFNATQSGYLMIPMMSGLLITSVVTGRIVSNTGRYKWVPAMGMGVVAVALFLLSTMTPTLPIWQLCVYLTMMGIGLGMNMMVMGLIVQNQFPAQVGTATAANNYFRQLGASLGAALVGSLFVNNLKNLFAERFPDVTAIGVGQNSLTPGIVRSLPDSAREVVINSYNDAMTPVFLYMVPFIVVSLVVLLFIREKPLATTLEHGNVL